MRYPASRSRRPAGCSHRAAPAWAGGLSCVERSVQRDPRVQLPAVETAAAQPVQLFAEFVLEPPAADVAGDAAAGADLQDPLRSGAEDASEQRAGRNPGGKDQIGPQLSN